MQIADADSDDDFGVQYEAPDKTSRWLRGIWEVLTAEVFEKFLLKRYLRGSAGERQRWDLEKKRDEAAVWRIWHETWEFQKESFLARESQKVYYQMYY